MTGQAFAGSQLLCKRSSCIIMLKSLSSDHILNHLASSRFCCSACTKDRVIESDDYLSGSC
jgi:hypothetical protein